MITGDLKQANHELRKDIHHLFQILEFINESGELRNPELNKILDKCLERRGQIDITLKKIEQVIGKEEVVV